jgi:hypothetical protein
MVIFWRKRLLNNHEVGVVPRDNPDIFGSVCTVPGISYVDQRLFFSYPDPDPIFLRVLVPDPS